MFLKTRTFTSNASRRIKTISRTWLATSPFKKLTYRKKVNAGRSSTTGRVIVWTKGSTLKRIRLPSVVPSFRQVQPLVVTGLHLVPFSNKLLALTALYSGAFMYLPATSSTRIFSLTSILGYKTLHPSLRRAVHSTPIARAPLFRPVSNVELYPNKGVQYIRSAGCSGEVLKFDRSTHSALVRLPSGVKKFFSLYSMVCPSPAALDIKKNTGCTKSGFWRSYGVKPKVRGVARNPVDHPHGGRTKAIKYPRTPWGKTTKFK